MSKPATRSGCSSASRISSLAPVAPRRVRMANSSSPIRAGELSWAKAPDSREPRADSTRSARSCPRASFRRRNRSTSATTSSYCPGTARVSAARTRKVRRSSRPVRVSRSAPANLVSSATTPAARRPSSSQTPRHRQVSQPRIRRRTAISVPSACGFSRRSARARSWGMVRAVKAAPEHSGARGPRPSDRVAPVNRIWSSAGVHIHRAASAAASASIAVVGSQVSALDRVLKAIPGSKDWTRSDLGRTRPE